MVSILMVVEKGLGFIHNVLIARQFKLSPEFDAFNVANNLPQTIFGVISGGALGMVLIPALTATLQEEDRAALWRMFSRVFNLLFLVTAAASLLVAIFAGPLVRSQIGLAPGFSPSQQALVVNLMRLNLVATLFFSLAGLAIAGQQANQRFFLPALAPAMYDIGILFGVIVLCPITPYRLGPITIPTLGLGIYGLVYSTILGGFLYLVVQLPGLLALKFRWTPELGLRDPRLRRLALLFIPRTLTVLCIYLVSIIQDNLASRLITGSVTAMVYAWLIFSTPETLIGTALGHVLLPTLSEQIARREAGAFTATLNRAVGILLALTLPLSVIISIVMPPVVAILGFGEGTDLVVWTARAYLLGLAAHTLLEIAVRSYYAQQRVLIPLAAAGFMLVIFTLLAIPLSRWLGAPGFGLANAIAYSAETLLLLYLLHRAFGRFLHPVPALLRALAAAAAGGAVSFALLHFLGGVSFFASSLIGGILLAILAGIGGVAAAAPIVLPELKQFLHL